MRLVLGLASTAVAAAAKTESLVLFLATEPAQEDEKSRIDEMLKRRDSRSSGQTIVWPQQRAILSTTSRNSLVILHIIYSMTSA